MVEIVTPELAWSQLLEDKNSYLIDVRTDAEWHFVGVPDLRSAAGEIIMLSLLEFPDMQLNQSFISEFKTRFSDNLEAKFFFLCKIGARSQKAAELATEAGFKNAFNIVGGFEGEINDKGQRGQISGWKFLGLPWYQN